MPWSFSRFEPRNPVLLDNYFSAIGKALALANNFEHKLQHVLGVVLTVEQIQKFGYGANHEVFTQAYGSAREKKLVKTIDALQGKDGFSDSDLEVLHLGRRARNLLAHEGPEIINASDTCDQEIYYRVVQLKPVVIAVADADNLVSKWTYEIQERKPAPRYFFDSYQSRAISWVFGDLLGTALTHVRGKPEPLEF